MKTKKISLNTIKNALSRSEMRKITAGSGGSLCVASPCGENSPCFFFMPTYPCGCLGGTCGSLQ